MRWIRHRTIILVNAIIYFNCIIAIATTIRDTTTTVCLFCFVSVEIERLMFLAKNQFFLIELIHSRLHPVNFRVQLRKMNKVVILGENIVRSGNSQDQRVLAGLVKNSGNL